jgi:hypothetical protein
MQSLLDTKSALDHLKPFHFVRDPFHTDDVKLAAQRIPSLL